MTDRCQNRTRLRDRTTVGRHQQSNNPTIQQSNNQKHCRQNRLADRFRKDFRPRLGRPARVSGKGLGSPCGEGSPIPRSRLSRADARLRQDLGLKRLLRRHHHARNRLMPERVSGGIQVQAITDKNFRLRFAFGIQHITANIDKSDS